MIKVAMFDTKNYDIESFNKELEEEDKLSFSYFETKLTKDTASLTSGFDVVCVFVNDTIDKDVINILIKNNVKLIALRCAGFNNVDLEYCYKRIHVVRVPAYSPHAVAEHAMALLLTSNRRIHKAYIRSRDYNFSLNNLIGINLYGKTVGIIGTGKIGKIFIDICKGFGMNVIAYDKFPDLTLDINYVNLDELYANSDFISLHCPLTDENRHMIDSNAINKMKNGVFIINTSRGGLINSFDLLEGIKERKVGAACLDVYEEESDVFFQDKSDHILNDDILARLISMPNVIVTSHQGFLTKEALENIAQITIKNITSFIAGEACENELCYRCEKLGNCKKNRQERCF